MSVCYRSAALAGHTRFFVSQNQFVAAWRALDSEIAGRVNLWPVLRRPISADATPRVASPAICKCVG